MLDGNVSSWETLRWLERVASSEGAVFTCSCAELAHHVGALNHAWSFERKVAFGAPAIRWLVAFDFVFREQGTLKVRIDTPASFVVLPECAAQARRAAQP